MLEVQAVCGRCGREYAYFQPEEGDTTAKIEDISVNSNCPHCGYPEILKTIVTSPNFKLELPKHPVDGTCPKTNKEFKALHSDEGLPSIHRRIGATVYCSECGASIHCC